MTATVRQLTWITDTDTGVSSKVIWATMLGVPCEPWAGNHPLDPDDLGRCLRLLSLFPEWRARLDEMAAVSPQWAALVREWPALEALWKEEGDGTLRPPRGTAMPRLYERMQEIIDGSYAAEAAL